MIFLKTQSKHCRRFKSPQKKIWLIGKLACGKTNLGGSGPLSILYVSSNWTLDFPATCCLLATRCHFFTRLRPIGNAQRKIWLIGACLYVFQLLHLKPWKAPDMEKAMDVADISWTQIHPLPWPDIMSVTWKKRQMNLPFESMLCKYLNITIIPHICLLLLHQLLKNLHQQRHNIRVFTRKTC